MVIKLKSICYCCTKKATSREHVPPKCLFPETKEIGRIYENDYRRFLITVPSCDEHNLAKSGDDQYLMVCLASRFGNNGVAYVYANKKVRRTIARNPNLISIHREHVVAMNGKQFPVQIINIDIFRLVNSFEAIARALIFHEFSFSYRGRCQVISDLLCFSESKEYNHFQLNGFMSLNFERKKWFTEVKGSNPEIFTYQFSNLDGIGTFTVALTFYEKTVVYVIMTLLDASKDLNVTVE